MVKMPNSFFDFSKKTSIVNVRRTGEKLMTCPFPGGELLGLDLRGGRERGPKTFS